MNKTTMRAGVVLFLVASRQGLAESHTAPRDSVKTETGVGRFDTAILLVGDPSVQADLGCRPEQKEAIRALLAGVGQSFWVLRDLPLEKSRERLEPLVERLETGARSILSPTQQRRLEQIMVQRRGPDALLWPQTGQALQLSEGQLEKIRGVLQETRSKLQELQNGPPGDDDEAARYKAAYEIRSREQDQILAILTDRQKRVWAARRGRRFDLSKLSPIPVRAPQLQDAELTEAWVNSGPLTLAGLRGQVVIVHFWTFGCINCIHNYEHYKSWQRDFAGKDLTIVGIHAPETEGEHDVSRLQAKATENGLKFAILVDNRKSNWKAWGNSMWPSVYLVDRRGYVRYWWYGELQWAGVDGERIMRARIEELLAEKPGGEDVAGEVANP